MLLSAVRKHCVPSVEGGSALKSGSDGHCLSSGGAMDDRGSHHVCGCNMTPFWAWSGLGSGIFFGRGGAVVTVLLQEGRWLC